jgi:hypothetical protein
MLKSTWALALTSLALAACSSGPMEGLDEQTVRFHIGAPGLYAGLACFVPKGVLEFEPECWLPVGVDCEVWFDGSETVLVHELRHCANREGH